MKARADDDGIVLETREPCSYDVLFDGEAIWSFSTRGGGPRAERQRVSWPDAMRPWLDGRARVTLRPSGAPTAEEGDDADGTDGADGADGAAWADGRAAVDLGEVGFGSGEGTIAFVDKRGMPVVIDKWGIVQRPFSVRGADVTAEMAERTQQVIDVLREDLGLDAWMAFGTLLGAAREGRAIGHDSDVDLLYLSEHSSPAQVNLECYRIKRALARRGLWAIIKAGSFVTVLFRASDGAPVGIDVYACFYLDGLLHETATVRAPVPRSAVLPLGTMEFEGRELPAPADPSALLEVSYGPGWRTPDPSFRHRPGPAIINRFDGWFGSLMTNRRAWEMWWHRHQQLRGPSDLAQRLIDDARPRDGVVELGAGNGSDAVAMARSGLRVLGYDFARHSFPTAVGLGKQEDLALTLGLVNLYDLRDVLSSVAVLRRRPRPPRTVLARHVLDALHPRGVDPFHRYLRALLRGGGRAYLQVDVAEGVPSGRYGSFDGAAPRYGVAVPQLRERLEADGARVVLAEQVEVTEADQDGPPRTRWHLVAEWATP